MDAEVLARYNEKVKQHCGGVDPYMLADTKDPLPDNIQFYDIQNYCIGRHSSYTKESFRAYKTLEAYKLYESGCVQSVMTKNVATGKVSVARVKHSYSSNLPPLNCWVAVDHCGIILSAHCNCMAGLGEVCSHVGAVLFLLEHWGRLSDTLENPDEISCTDVLAKWVIPSTKKVEMASVRDIVWDIESTASQDVSMHDSSIILIDSSMDVNMLLSDTVEEEDLQVDEDIEESDEIDRFLSRIRENGVFCPIMALREPFSKYFIEKTSDDLLKELSTDDVDYISIQHLLLSSLHNPFYEGVPLEDLQEIASRIQLTYTDEDIAFIESKTRDQSSCKLWFQFRIGRVTGSTFAKVCRTQLLSPALSTIKQICYPEQNIFYSQQTAYGNKNEAIARDCYAEAMRREHRNFSIRATGLIINNSYPFCGASPDAVVHCDCCGSGTLDIKCPWSLRGGDMNAYLRKRDCPIVVVDGEDGSWTYRLKQKHEYYYQVQMQMFITNTEYSDFVVWQLSTEARNPTITIRVFRDEPLWQVAYPRACLFFEKVLLPELIGCHYTRRM